MKIAKRGQRLSRTVIAAAVSACFLVDAVLANPTGPKVVSGAATFQQAGNTLQITNSPNAIINWQSFSIGASEITRFIQQSQASAVLNRVTGSAGVIDPSVILGALQSNGRVFLVNPSGILFGAGAQIDVAGLVATSLNLSNADFLAGKLKFSEVPGAGSIVNQGNITTGAGGNVYLVGPAVTNSGIITSPKGEVILAAGNSVGLVNPGTPNLRVEVAASESEARNIGSIIADSGRIGIYAGLINHSGTIRANGASVTEDGRIVLKATKNATLEAGSVTTANGANGGSISVQSGDTTLVAGTVEAKGSEGKGGNIEVLGNLVGLTGNASLNASGDTGGGTVLVGGDLQGKNLEVQNAFRTYVGAGTAINADALTNGDGGKVIVWSDDATRAYGTISARGGTQSGNGGFVEISGKHNLDFNGRVDAGAANGTSGTVLFDPDFLTIIDSGGVNNGEVGGADASVLFADGGSASFTIDDEALEALTGNVVLQANRDITVQTGLSGGLTFTTFGQSVTMEAGGNITANSPIATNNGNISFISGGNLTVASVSNTGSADIELTATSGNLAVGTVTAGRYALLRATAGAITDFNGSATNVTAQYLEAAAANGINLDTAVSGASPSYVNATNSTSGDISLRNTTSSATVQNIHNAGGNNNLSGLITDSQSTIVTGGTVIHGAWTGPDGSGGQSTTSPLNPQFTFTTNGGGVRITLNSPRANTTRSDDPYLYLLDAGGTLIAEDDDAAGQGYVAMINQPNLAAGTYTVVAATYSSGQRAPFDLSIGGSVTGAAPPPPPPPAVDQAINQVVTATNQQFGSVAETPGEERTTTSSEQSSSVTETPGEERTTTSSEAKGPEGEKKKGLPICK